MADRNDISLKTLFGELLDTWSARSWTENHPARKNRIQALGEIRDRLAVFDPAGDFETDRAALIELVEICAGAFDPAFDTEYGSGRDVHGALRDFLNRL
jgi:hypothetical protein